MTGVHDHDDHVDGKDIMVSRMGCVSVAHGSQGFTGDDIHSIA